MTDESQSKVLLSGTFASPPSSPQRTRFLHTTPVHHFAGKSENCHTPTSTKAFENNDCEMRYSCDDAGESLFAHDHNKPVVHDGSASVELSKMFETGQSKRPRIATLSGFDEEEFSGDFSMFDYNCSVDSDGELGPGIYDAPESISLGLKYAGQGGMPFISAEHCIPDRNLMTEENGNQRFMASHSRPEGTGDLGDATSCTDVGIIKADTGICDNDVAGSTPTDQNFNGCLNENSLCDVLGNYDHSLSSNSLVSPNGVGAERNIYKMLHSVESSSHRISKDTEDAAFNLPVRFDGQSAELWSHGDLKSEKALIKQPPKCETSSIPSFPCNSVSAEIKSLKPKQTSHSSNVTLSKIPNQTRTLLRMPKSINHEVEERTVVTSSGSSVASVPPSGMCSSSETVHVVPEVTNLNQRQLKEPTSSKLPSLRPSRVPKQLPTFVSK